MRVSVYDTYVQKNDQTTMHFDILVPEGSTTEKVYEYGKKYLAEKAVDKQKLTTQECNFCHMETAPEEVEKSIQAEGYYILEMENCK